MKEIDVRNKSPKFSIIVPIYKVESYVEHCIESVLAQSYGNFECILVDDGSPDKCGEICDEYAKRDERIKVIHKPNGGLSDARNAGLRIALGEFVCFLDGDDYIESDLLECINDNIQDADLLVFNYDREDEDGKRIFTSSFIEADYHINSEEEYLDFICKYIMTYKLGWEAWNRVYKRDIIKKNELYFFDNKKIYAEDLHFFLCYLINAKNIKVIGKVLYHYIIRSDSITQANKETKINEFVELNYQYYKYLKINNYTYLIRNYYVMFYCIMSNRYKQSSEYDTLMSMAGVSRKKFLKDNLAKIIINCQKVSAFLRCNKNELRYINLQYYLYSGSSIGYKMIRRALRSFISSKRKIKYLPDRLWKKNIYLLGTEDCGNLGDHMIAVAEIKFIKDHFNSYNLIECPLKQYWNNKNDYKNRIKRSDIIFLTGGGNMGDMYPYSESLRESVLSEFGKNKIIIFPQTVFFEDETNVIRSSEIYNSASRLILAARERYSYDLCKKIYKNIKVLEVPDIVLYLEKNADCARNSIRLCLRSDKEKTMTDAEYETLMNYINSLGEKIERFDMQLDHDISISERNQYLYDILLKYQTAKLIVTDRLHGMILSAISGTPCVAIGSKSYKIKGSYKWLSELPYIEYIEDISKLPDAAKRVLNEKDNHYDNEFLLPYFEQITASINGE